MAPPLRVAEEEGEQMAEYSALVVWVDWQRVAISCPVCSSVEESNLEGQNSRQSFNVPATVRALCDSNVRLRLSYPGMLLNWEKGRFEVIRPRNFEVARNRSIPKINTEQFENVELDATMSEDAAGSDVGNETNDLAELEKLIIPAGLESLATARPGRNMIDIMGPMVPNRDSRTTLARIKSYTSPEGKTVAILYRGATFKAVVAISGWESHLSGCRYVLDQKKWSSEVCQLQIRMNHLPGPARFFNRYKDGEESNCHAEKLAMAFLIRYPPKSRKAWIALDRPACDNCEELRDKLEKEYKVRITFVMMGKQGQNETQLKTPQARPRKPPVLTPPSSGAKRQKDDRESSYYRNESCDDTYQESDSDENEERQEDENDKMSEDSGNEAEPEDWAEDEDTIPPSPSRRLRRRAIQHYETEAGRLHSITAYETIGNDAHLRKRSREEMSCDSESLYVESERALPASVHSRRHLETPRAQNAETEDDPLVDKASQSFTPMEISSDESEMTLENEYHLRSEYRNSPNSLPIARQSFYPLPSHPSTLARKRPISNPPAFRPIFSPPPHTTRSRNPLATPRPTALSIRSGGMPHRAKFHKSPRTSIRVSKLALAQRQRIQDSIDLTHDSGDERDGENNQRGRNYDVFDVDDDNDNEC